MSASMDRAATDTSVTELLTGVDFENVKNDDYRANGFIKPYRNGYNKVKTWLHRRKCIYFALIFCRNVENKVCNTKANI